MPGMDFFGKEEVNEVQDVLRSACFFRYNHEHLRNGMWKSKELEQETQKFTGARYAHALSSGSTAVSTMLSASGVGFGDEVIVPPFTYVAPIESVLLAGALPVFADIDETLCLSVEGLEKAITPKTKAILLVHMCGAPAYMDGITKFCKERNLLLLEDAGQAMGAFHRGKSVGLFGKAGAFSFDFFKITTMGEGGMVITNDKATYHNAEQVSDHGHSHIGNNRGMESHPVIGSNYRISEVHAAVGLAQMRKLPHIIKTKRHNKSYLKDRLSQIDGITFRKIHDEKGDSATFLNFFVEDQKTAQKLMNAFSERKLAGFNYWFTNMYHFINQWDHIKNLKSASKLAIHDLGAPQDYNNLELPKAQDTIGRLISLGIKGNWSKHELAQFADNMVATIEATI
ncbi:L-glutamine:2-deoxy-scyllo-inosose aminotransferase [Elysia marginata]|uniref:L-glutamine:2-deoxy-scyllo-inosose aminotransferase n=1 Tax=Elysia marginata TaxID=1093978 RepID=A0AAV4HIT9_9GAST|nr:L-glutamine:2-deoxy-scyllo-inosose aminotransferase [Elysia marginata]